MPDNIQVILAIETSGTEGNLAIQTHDGQVRESRFGSDSRRHAQTLVAEAEKLLEAVELSASEIDIVAVSNGPGSFTGLRVGTVFAKTIAWANSAKLIDVDTLQVIACAAPKDEAIVTAVSDAQRSELFINRYTEPDDTGIRHAIDELTIIPVDDLNQQFQKDHHGVVSGPGLSKFAARLANCQQTDSSAWQPMASWVLRIGAQRAARTSFADIARLEPVYVRRSYAEEKRN